MKALIIGAGVAGPVLGMFLRRLGMEVVVCEARAEEEADGAFLGLAPNGLNVLAELGLAERVHSEGVVSKGFRFQNARGEEVGVIDGRDDEARFGQPLIIVKRGELQRALVERAREGGVEVQFSARLVDLKETTARFENGREVSADLVVGCDGLRSRTRALALPGSPEPKYVGQLSFGGYGRCDDAPLQPGWQTMIFGKRSFFGAVKADDGMIWWFHNDGEADARRSLTQPESRARLISQHEEDPEWINRLITASPTVLGPWALHDIVTIPKWHAGRVCLIGDAAHATTPNAGQGASLALEDALVLAKCLRDERSPEAAFVKLEHLRRARVERIVKASRRVGASKITTNAVSLWFRDRMLSFFLRLGAKASADQYAHRISWE